VGKTEKGESDMATDFDKHTKELYAAINAHDLDNFLSLHTDDIVVTMADGTVLRGKKEVRAYFEGTFTAFSDVRADLTTYFSSGNRQCKEYVVSG
jgi:ketosteroid isomerase-like protein